MKYDATDAVENKTEQPAKKQGLSARAKVLLLAFSLVAGGVGIDYYVDNQKGSSLSADYARAAQCDSKKKVNNACTIEEETSVVKKEASESRRNIAEGLETVGTLLGMLAFLG